MLLCSRRDTVLCDVLCAMCGFESESNSVGYCLTEVFFEHSVDISVRNER